MSNFDNDISEELNREANMFELETESPEIEDEAIGTDSTSKFEDNTLFLEDSTPFEEEVTQCTLSPAPSWFLIFGKVRELYLCRVTSVKYFFLGIFTVTDLQL